MAKKMSEGRGKGTRKYHRTEEKPCQKRYVASNRAFLNKKRRAQRLANKFGYPIMIKNRENWVTIEPKIAV